MATIDINKVADEILQYEPEFKAGGFVVKHMKDAKSDPMVAIKSVLDRLTDMYDLEREDIGPLSEEIFKRINCK
tara:strand:+ start:234 stop:455 length:222 start_codon:yes stop_codon:yes gene_type:complete